MLAIGYVTLIIILQRAKLYFFNTWLGIIGLASIFFAGSLCLLNHQGSGNSAKLQHQIHDTEAYVVVALEDAIIVKEDRLYVTVAMQQAHIQGKWQKLTGKVRLLVDKSSATTIQYGEVYMIVGQPQLIADPRNPEEFNYKRFLGHEHIYYHHRVCLNSLRKITYAPPSYLQVLCLRIRSFCERILTQHMVSMKERSIVLALVLGIKDELNIEVRDAYASAGTMHILAVSGLHVGILYWLLNILLYRRKKLRPRSRWLSSIIICGGLCIYAGMTVLSPSVVRATLMFSFVILARLLGRAGNIYNLLSVSAFLLLLVKPLLIFSISFQLSYLAVLGIIYLQPKIYGWFNFKNIVLRQLWLWTSVSLAAQLATTPISLYYFHQFPTYFIFANWVVVPAAFFIFILGLCVLFTCWWVSLSACIAWLLEYLTGLVNQFVAWISSLPYSVLSDIYIHTQDLLLWYGLIISVLVFLAKKEFRILWSVSAVAVLLSLRTTLAIVQYQHQQGVIFYSIPGHQAVGLLRSRENLLLVDEDLYKQDKKFTYHIKPSQVAMGIHKNYSYTFKQASDMATISLSDWHGITIGVWGHKKFIFLNKTGSYFPDLHQKIYTDFLVIEGNSIQSLKLLLEQFEFKHLIIGASITKQLDRQLKEEADRLQLNNHSLRQQGALKVFW